MRNLLLALWIFLNIALVASAKPDRKDPVPKAKKDHPAAILHETQTNWGLVKIVGNRITLTGHEQWQAEGRILKDGKISLLWTFLADGKRAPGLYEWDNEAKELRGVWAWGEHVTVEEDGSLTGTTFNDRIYRMIPPVN